MSNRQVMSRKHQLMACVFSFSMVSTAGAWAQSATEPPPPPSQVDEVVVTALKRSQTLTSVPASISALDSKALEQRGVTTLNDIQLQTPSLSFGTALGTNQVSIRGVGLTIATGAGEPGVAVHLDGVYEARPALSSLAEFDLERVEVLKGPQGTLYGRNATAGAVNFISRAPTNEFEGYAKIGYAQFNEFHAEGVVSGPLTSGVRGRLGITYTDRGQGFLENFAPGQGDVDKVRNLGARGRLAFDLSPDATLDLELTYLHTSGSQIYLTPESPLDPNTVAFNPALATALYSTSPTRTAIDTPHMSRTATSPVATLSWDLGFAKLKSISGYSYIKSSAVTDADGTSAKMGSLPNGYTSRQFTQEFDLTGTIGNLDWIGGAYYLHENYKAYQDVIFANGFTAPYPIPGVGIIPIPVFAPGDTTYQHWSEKRQSYAAFVDGTYHVTPKFGVFAGARYSHDEFTMNQTVGTLPAGFACQNLTNTVDFSSVTPRVGFQYQAEKGSNLYGSVSRGYKSGGLNFGTCNDSYNPEKLTAYELGYKQRFAENGITFGAAAFYYDYRDLQVYQLRPITSGGGSFIDNAPRATVKGVEGDFAWQPNEHFQMNLGLSFLDAKYEEYSNTDSSILGAGPQDLKGFRIPKSPTFTGNLGLQYTSSDIGGLGHFTLRGEAYHSAKQYYTEFNKPQDMQGAYTIYNAYLTWQFADDKYSARLYARNLTDEHYFNFVTSSPLSGTTLVTYAPPRQVGIELSVKF